MPNSYKAQFLRTVEQQHGRLRRLENTQSLFDVEEDRARLYVRYSRIHAREQAFYGLRQEDLELLEGHNSIICFLWDRQDEPLCIPFSDYKEVFDGAQPANDGQYKVMLFFRTGSPEMYMARAGRFNVEGHMGWQQLANQIGKAQETVPADLSHPQIQSILAAIGHRKGFDLWIPMHDRETLDAKLEQFRLRSSLPDAFSSVDDILREVDVVWIQHGGTQIRALYEVEHSTSIYSALLRFNDIHLDFPTLHPQFVVVADHSRRALFSRQVLRPTFRASGLDKECSFLEYGDAYRWYLRTTPKQQE